MAPRRIGYETPPRGLVDKVSLPWPLGQIY